MLPLCPPRKRCGTAGVGYVDKLWEQDDRVSGGRRRQRRADHSPGQGRIDPMYLLLAAHADGAALQEVTAEGVPEPSNPKPRIVSAGDLAGVVREFEERHPRWIWHRTQDWYPRLLRAGVELERCYDLTLCGMILAHSEATAHTGYAQAAEKLTQDDELNQPPRALQPPPPPPDQGALFDAPAPGQRPGQSLEALRAELRHVSQ